MSPETPTTAWDSETTKQLNSILEQTRKAGMDIGLPAKFLEDLMEDVNNNRDWSFIIKSHALMETALNYMLAERLVVTGAPIGYKKDEIGDYLSGLPMGGPNGKIKLASTLGLANSDLVKFLVKLGEIRNFYAHDLRNIPHSLKKLIFELKKNRQHEFCEAFIPSYKENKAVFDSFKQDVFPLLVFMSVCVHLHLIISLYSKPPPTLLGTILSDKHDETNQPSKD